MAVLTKTQLKGPYPVTPATAGGTAITWTSRAPGGDEFAYTGNEILLAWNNGATGTATVTVSSVKDAMNRTGDAAMVNIATGDMVAFGQFNKGDGWLAADGNIDVVASGTGAADIDYAVLVLF
jgi:hypothetical protein